MKKRPFIIYAITSFEHGGAQKNMFELVRRTHAAGDFDVAVVSLKSGGLYEKKFRGLGVPTISMGLGGLSVFHPLRIAACVFRLAEYARENSADIIHSFLFQANIVSRFASAFSGAKNVSSIRVMEKEKKSHRWASRLTGFFADKITVNSSELARFVAATEGAPPEKIAVIGNYIDLSARPGRSSDIRRVLGLNDGDFLVSAVGRLVRQKGFDYLIDAVNLLKEDMSALKVVIVGGGELEKHLREKISSLGLEGRVSLIGPRVEAAEIIASSDVFVLPSLWEGFPNVVLEAVAAGVPTIATDASCVGDFLESGYIVKSGDAVEIAHKILDVARSPSDASHAVSLSESRLGSYSDESIFEKYFDIYRGLIGGTK